LWLLAPKSLDITVFLLKLIHMLATNVFIPYALIPYYGAMPGFAKLPQKKNAAILKKDYNAL